MIDPASIPTDARLHLRPEGFIDTPVGRDGEVARLAGGLLWFAAYELIAVRDSTRVVQASVPVPMLPGLIANLPEPQAARLRTLAERISAPRPALTVGARTIRLDQPQVIGIVDAAEGDAARRGFDMGVGGAALIAVGGEADAKAWEGDEIARVVPVIEALAPSGTAVAITTRKAGVMEAALAAGAGMIDDASALAWDDRALAVAAAASCPVVLAHSAEPAGDVLIEVFDWLEARIDAVTARGIDRSRILVDPGLSAGKSLSHNLALLGGLALFHGLGCGIVLGASRARMIGALSNEAAADRRLGGSVALALHGAGHGVQLLRAHDVAETVQALKVWRGLKDAALTGRRD